MKVELRGVTKRFPGVVANQSVDLTLEAGEVHALLGENGAGKTTLMNVLYGLYSADEGKIVINGEDAGLTSPRDAIDAGIGMVHQHFMLVPVFTVTENVMLGVEETHGMGVLKGEHARNRLVKLSRDYGLEVPPDAYVEDLPVGVQQRVEILKALYRDVDLLILDEPTAVLTPQETRDLFRVVRTLREAGRTIVYISHKLKEVMEISDRITVLRRGRVVGSTTPTETNEQELATMMVGREVKFEIEKKPADPDVPILQIENLTVLDDRAQIAVDEISFHVKRGEILAIAGVQGNGQTELVEAITGMRPPFAGRILLEGRDVTGHSPRDIFGRGVAHVPEDRQGDGLVISFPIKDNLILNGHRKARFARGIAINDDAVNDNATRLIEEFDIRTTSINAPASTLSGGNQQKLIVARELSHAEKLLVASQPTRGLDIGSVQYIHERLVAARDEGLGVVVVSAELDEVMTLADRVAVMYRGKIVAVLDAAEASREKVGLLMAGATQQGV